MSVEIPIVIHSTVDQNMLKYPDEPLTLVLLNCLNCIFRHLKLELLTQFPASNEEKYLYLFSNIHLLN